MILGYILTKRYTVNNRLTFLINNIIKNCNNRHKTKIFFSMSLKKM